MFKTEQVAGQEPGHSVRHPSLSAVSSPLPAPASVLTITPPGPLSGLTSTIPVLAVRNTHLFTYNTPSHRPPLVMEGDSTTPRAQRRVLRHSLILRPSHLLARRTIVVIAFFRCLLLHCTFSLYFFPAVFPVYMNPLIPTCPLFSPFLILSPIHPILPFISFITFIL